MQIRLICHQIASASELVTGVECVRTPASNFLKQKQFGKNVQEHVAWADVVHLHQAWLWQNAFLANLARRQNKAAVLSPHGMLDDWSLKQKAAKKRIFLTLFQNFFRRDIDVFHCTADEERRQVCAALNLNTNRTSVVPLFVDPQVLAERSNAFVPRSRHRILFLSRIHPKKGLEFLIDAVSQLTRLGKNVELQIAGPGESGYESRLRERIVRHNLTDRVHFLGMVHGQEKLDLMEQADVFVLPTFQENFGLVLIEAMCLGVPTITTKGTDIWRELQDAGAVISRQDAGEIANAISKILDSPRHEFRPDQEKLTRWLCPTRLCSQYRHMYETVADR